MTTITCLRSHAFTGLTFLLASYGTMTFAAPEAKFTYAGNAAAPASTLALWYKTPALDWEKEALPIGNGLMGGKVFGGVSKEVIQVNDITLWTGGPGTNKGNGTYNYGVNPRIDRSLLGKINELVEKGDPAAAQTLMQSRYEDNHPKLLGDHFGMGAYQNVGEIQVDFALEGDREVKNYRRELDLENGIARVEYQLDGVNYKREVFCSYPDKVMVVHLTADAPMNFDVRFASAQTQATGYSHSIRDNTITAKGALTDNGERFETQLKVLPTGGSTTLNGSAIKVANTKEVLLILATATDYKLSYPTYRSGIDPHEPITKAIAEASSLGYQRLNKNHIADYRALFNRVKLNLGNGKPSIPTNELIAAYKKQPTRDLEVLFFQYGRYLMISSSRPGGLPANLQGIWNNSNTPIWNSDYHYNINLQMNYWPVEVTNLRECAEPLVAMIKDIVPSGRKTAAAYFQVGDGESPTGWTVNCCGNIYGFSSVGTQLSWAWAPGSNAFISQNLWEHYAFNRDKADLAKNIYPVLKEACQFWLSYLRTDSDGTLTSPAGYSPEQMHFSKGIAYDQQLVWELFTNTIEASEALGVDEALRKELNEKRAKLSPIQIGDQGQIMEWKNFKSDLASGATAQNVEPEHRHLSHLVSLYPGKQINCNTTTWMEAAKISLDRRTGDSSRSTGWTTAWKINARARTHQGDRAHEMLTLQLSRHTMDNLWDAHGKHDDQLWTFQIEGNFGATSGVAEMLLQSHTDTVDLLPALPSAWAKGSYSGLRARGNHTIALEWDKGTPIKASVKAGSTGTLRLRNERFTRRNGMTLADSKGQKVTFFLENNAVTFQSKAGEIYTLSCSN